VDLVTFRGELALACPGCKRGLLRLLFGMSENVSAPPAPAPPVEITTAPAAASDDPGCTQPPQFGTDDEVEPEDVDGGLTPRQTLRDYEILHELGRGGMGVVYRAKHKALNRVVALKMILSGVHAGADEIARFRVEAEAIARLKHPNIVQVYDIRQQDGQAYFSLEFCGGGSLSGKLRGKPLVPKEAARIVESLARAMQAVHDAGILHRDLKPANVLLTDDGTPKITDFGLAKKLDEGGQGKTRTGAIVGTPAYMAPEQAEGKKDLGPSADIYALGAILYECLTGRPPFQAATTLDTVLQVISDEPVPPRRLNSKVPRDLEVICLKCLRKAPRGRYASAAALADDVRRYLDGEPIEARRPGILRRTWMATRKRPIYALLALLLALGLILGVIDYARSRNVFQGFTWEEVRRIWDLLWSDPPGKPSIPPRRSDGT
jgi:serine/threonine-protein kinase